MTIGYTSITSGLYQGLRDVRKMKQEDEDRQVKRRMDEQAMEARKMQMDAQRHQDQRNRILEKRADDEFRIQKDYADYKREGTKVLAAFYGSNGEQYSGMVDLFNSKYPNEQNIEVSRNPEHNSFKVTVKGPKGSKTTENVTMDRLGKLFHSTFDPNAYVSMEMARQLQAREFGYEMEKERVKHQHTLAETDNEKFHQRLTEDLKKRWDYLIKQNENSRSRSTARSWVTIFPSKAKAHTRPRT